MNRKTIQSNIHDVIDRLESVLDGFDDDSEPKAIHFILSNSLVLLVDAIIEKFEIQEKSLDRDHLIDLCKNLSDAISKAEYTPRTDYIPHISHDRVNIKRLIDEISTILMNAKSELKKSKPKKKTKKVKT